MASSTAHEHMFAAVSDGHLARFGLSRGLSADPCRRRLVGTRPVDPRQGAHVALLSSTAPGRQPLTRPQGYGYLTAMRTLEADLEGLDVTSG